MKGVAFPLFKTKLDHEPRRFNLEDVSERKAYFELKIGDELKKLREFLKDNTFVGFLLGKKNSGKGTYSKLFKEALGVDLVEHISVGDIVRSVDKAVRNENDKEALVTFLTSHYRGFVPVQDVINIIVNRDTTKLLPTEAILALVEYEISRKGHKAVFIDGFPRNLDQISFSLYFRALMGYRDHPDFFAFIDVPEAILDERIRYRVVCPTCQTPRNTKLLKTEKIEYDTAEDKFYLICDDPACNGPRMVPKEGGDLGLEAFRDRLELDEQVMKKLMELQGVPQLFLRNSVPVDKATQYVADYEITPAYSYSYDKETGKVMTHESPWTVKDDNEEEVNSLLPAPVVVSFVKQLVKALAL